MVWAIFSWFLIFCQRTQTLQVCCLSLWTCLLWAYKFFTITLQIPQLTGLASCTPAKCFLKSPLFFMVLSHFGHLNNFASPCALALWTWILLTIKSQILHFFGSAPWFWMCWFKSDLLLYLQLQMLHSNLRQQTSIQNNTTNRNFCGYKDMIT